MSEQDDPFPSSGGPYRRPGSDLNHAPEGHDDRVFGVRQLLALCAILLTLVVVLISVQDHDGDDSPDSGGHSAQPVETFDLP